MSNPQPAPRLDSLTGLRFFAAILVVLLHISQKLPTSETAKWLTSLGYTGVSFFFALSGFVLTWSARPGDKAGQFYGRRLARVWPAHVVTAAISIPVLYQLGNGPNWASLPLVLLLLHAWIPDSGWYISFNGPSWSLAVEAFFYGIFPLIAKFFFSTARMWRWLVAGAIILLIGGGTLVVVLLPDNNWGYLLYINPAYRVGEFALGIAAALAVKRGMVTSIPLPIAALLPPATYIILLIYGPRDSHGDIPLFFANIVMLVSFLILIVSSAKSDILQRRSPFRAKFLVNLGERSFALYLIHLPIVGILSVTIKRWDFTKDAWMAVSLGALVASIVASHFLYAYVERPAERWIRRRLGDRRGHPAVVDIKVGSSIS